MQDFEAILEQHKSLLSPQVYQQLKQATPLLSEGQKKAIAAKLESGARVKAAIDDYDEKRMAVLFAAAQEFQKVETHLSQKYNESYHQIESEDRQDSFLSAEEALRQI